MSVESRINPINPANVLVRQGTVGLVDNWDINGYRIINAGVPVNPGDLATKSFVESLIPNVSVYFKTDGSIAATGNFNINNHDLIDVNRLAGKAGQNLTIEADGQSNLSLTTNNVRFNRGVKFSTVLINDTDYNSMPANANIVGYNALTAARTVTMIPPATVGAEQRIRIKDLIGRAGKFPITISGSFGTETKHTINSPYGEHAFYSDGTFWLPENDARLYRNEIQTTFNFGEDHNFTADSNWTDSTITDNVDNATGFLGDYLNHPKFYVVQKTKASACQILASYLRLTRSATGTDSEAWPAVVGSTAGPAIVIPLGIFSSFSIDFILRTNLEAIYTTGYWSTRFGLYYQPTVNSAPLTVANCMLYKNGGTTDLVGNAMAATASDRYTTAPFGSQAAWISGGVYQRRFKFIVDSRGAFGFGSTSGTPLAAPSITLFGRTDSNYSLETRSLHFGLSLHQAAAVGGWYTEITNMVITANRW